MVISIASDKAWHLGVLSSRINIEWALRLGGTLEDRPRYNKSRCFETFAFPDPSDNTGGQIATLAEQLDGHRRRQQAQCPSLTLTGMYNTLEKLRREESLSAKEKEIHEHGLVSVLREIHDDLDDAVFKAYGWDDLANKLVGRPGATTPWREKPSDQAEAEEELLQRLVNLNHQRATEEAQGKVRWLRPEYQAPEEMPQQETLATGQRVKAAAVATATSASKDIWPKTLQDQVRSIRGHLADSAMDAETLASRFKRKPVKSVSAMLDALTELGMIRAEQGDNGRVFRS